SLQIGEERRQDGGGRFGEFQHVRRVFALGGHVAQVVRRQGDQLCQDDGVRGGPGGDEILRQLGGYVRGAVGERGLFVGEVVEERARRDPGFGADLVDRDLVESPFQREGHGGVAAVGARLASTALA